MTTCPLCGKTYDEKNTGSACKGCPMAKGCTLIRCPNCGYETPPEPVWIGKLKTALKRLKKEPKQ